MKLTAEEYRAKYAPKLSESALESTKESRITKDTSKSNALRGEPPRATNKVQSELKGSGFEEYDSEFEAVTKSLHLPDFLHCAFGNRFVQLTDKHTLAKLLLIRLPPPGFDIEIKALEKDGFSINYKKIKT